MSESVTSRKSRQALEIFLDPEEVDYLRKLLGEAIARCADELTTWSNYPSPLTAEQRVKLDSLLRKTALEESLIEKLTS